MGGEVNARNYTQAYERKLERWKAAQRYRKRREEASRAARERREFERFLRTKKARAMDKAAAAWLAQQGFR